MKRKKKETVTNTKIEDDKIGLKHTNFGQMANSRLELLKIRAEMVKF